MDKLCLMPPRFETGVKIGLGLCVFGLAVGLTALVPSISGPGAFPWPVFAGTMIYLPGALMVAYFARGDKGRNALSLLRFVRLGFAVVMLIAVMRLMG